VIGLGEVGLDYYYENSPREVQREVFARQAAIAKDLGLPLIVHSRNAGDETLGILKNVGSKAGAGILHCFTGSLSMAREAVGLGYCISFGGMLTFKKADDTRETMCQVPMEALLIETDSPYLAPVPFRGKRNEPSYVQRVASEMAGLRGLSIQEIADRTTANFLRLFGIEDLQTLRREGRY
jgi:TatD DNase family protein